MDSFRRLQNTTLSYSRVRACTRARRTHDKDVAFLKLYHVSVACARIALATISSRPAAHMFCPTYHMMVHNNSWKTDAYTIHTCWRVIHNISFYSDYKLLLTTPAFREREKVLQNCKRKYPRASKMVEKQTRLEKILINTRYLFGDPYCIILSLFFFRERAWARVSLRGKQYDRYKP